MTIIVVLKTREPWTPERMMRIAKANDNGGVYYNATSGRSVRDLERLFRLREVAIVLEENVGAIVGGPGLTKPGEVLVQLHRRAVDDPRLLQDVRTCLEELRVDVRNPVRTRGVT